MDHSCNNQKNKCPKCGEVFDRLGAHYRWNPEHRPDITPRQHAIVTGILMGDGSAHKNDKTTRVKLESYNDKFTKWIFKELGNLACSIYDNGVYTFYHQELNGYSNWYKEDGKVFPKMNIPRITMKVWYCGDGGLQWPNGNSEYALSTIRCCNEKSRLDRLVDMIEDSTPLTCRTGKSGRIIFPRSVTKDFLEYIGNPVPGMEYKWEINSKFKYKMKMRESKENERNTNSLLLP